MKILLDTHIALWAISDDQHLSSKARQLILPPENNIFISVASIWEIVIKYSLARGRPNDMPISGKEALGFFQESGYCILYLTADHVVNVASLPDLHKDPFDRLIIAQALSEPLRLITHDRVVGGYSDTILVV